MRTPFSVFTRLARPVLGLGVLSLSLALGACGNDDGDSTRPGAPDTGGGPPAVCETAHCAPTP